MNNIEQLHLTKDQSEWFAERMETKPSGIVSVPSHLIVKAAKMMDNGYEHSNASIKTMIINECNRFRLL